jgi:hypothetical protein
MRAGRKGFENENRKKGTEKLILNLYMDVIQTFFS